MSTKKQLSASDKINLHHAYLLEGDFESCRTKVFDFLEGLGVKCAGNPNVFCQNFENFTIDDSRLIKELQLEMPASVDSAGSPYSERRFFVLGAGSMAGEAQNALLKTFEEPAPGVHFFLITPSTNILLETLRSRMHLTLPSAPPLLNKERGLGGEVLFLNLKKSERLKFVEKLIKKHSEDKAGLKKETNDLLNSLELSFSKSEPQKLKNLSFEIGEIIKCRKYLRDQGASVKMLLEHLAIILPER